MFINLKMKANKEFLDSIQLVEFIRSYPQTPSILALSTFFYLYGAGHLKFTPKSYTKREGLAGLMIFYTVSGSGILVYQNKKYTIMPQTAFFIDLNEYHEYKPLDSNSWEVQFIHFSGATSRAYLELINKNSGPIIPLSPDNKLSELFLNVLENIEKNDSTRELESSLLIHQILTEILKHSNFNTTTNIKQENSEIKSSIQLAMDYIEKTGAEG